MKGITRGKSRSEKFLAETILLMRFYENAEASITLFCVQYSNHCYPGTQAHFFPRAEVVAVPSLNRMNKSIHPVL